MSTDKPGERDDEEISRLVSWDEALAAGELPDSPTEVQFLEEPLLQKKIACVDLLRRLWPRQNAVSGNEKVHLDGAVLLPNRIGHFQILRELGRGGFGVVFLARDSKLGRNVALKVPRADVLVTPDLRGRFQQEARAAAGLDHPNLVPIYEAGEVGPICYIASAYCAGLSLAQWLQQQRHPVPMADAAGLVEALARAVHHAHGRGIIHRDLKPANVLLSMPDFVAKDAALAAESPLSRAVPKITDFGLAKVLDGETQHTQSGNLLGTPAYMAPEQAEGQRATIGPAVDIYALGVILYELLTGRPPFQADSGLATLLMVRKDEPLAPSRLRPKLPRDLETICLKCLEKNPSHRYASAQDLAEDLRRFQNAEPIHARPTGILGRMAKWSRRRPAAAMLIGVIALTALLLAAVLVVSDVEIRKKQVETEKALESAVEARNNYAKSLERERRTQYFYRIRLAYTSWQENNVNQAEQFLDACRPQPGETDLRGWEWHFLKRLCQSHVYHLRTGGEDTALDAAFSLDGKLLAVLHKNNTVKIIDAGAQKIVHTLTTSEPRLGASLPAFSPDGKLLLLGQESGTLAAWNVEDGRPVQIGRGHHVVYSPDGKLLATTDSKDHLIRVYDAQTYKEIRSHRVGPESTLGAGGNQALSPCSIVFRKDGVWVATPDSKDRRIIRVWNAETGQGRLELRGHRAFIGGLDFSPDGSRLASACAEGIVIIWDMSTGAEQKILPPHPATIRAIRFSPDGESLAVGDGMGNLKLWNSKGHEIRPIRGHLRFIHALAYRPDGRWLASSSIDRLFVTNIGKDADAVVVKEGKGFVSAFAFSKNSNQIASVGGGGNLKLWECDTGRIVLDQAAGLGALWHVARNHEGSRLFVVSFDGSAGKTFDAATGKVLHTVRRPLAKGKHRASSVCPACACFTTVSQDNAIHLWDWNTGQLLRTLTGHKAPVSAVEFSPDGRKFASASADRTVKLWETDTGRELFTLAKHEGAVKSIAFSWDGLRLASVGSDTSVHIWNVDSGQSVLTIHNRFGRNNVNSVTFSPDGRRLATAGFDHTVTIWDTESGEEALTLPTRRMGVGVLAFSDNGRFLAAASNDSTITIWDGLHWSD